MSDILSAEQVQFYLSDELHPESLKTLALSHERLREKRDKWKERAVEVGRRAFDAESLLAQQKATLERDDLTPATIVTMLRCSLLEPQRTSESSCDAPEALTQAKAEPDA